MVRAERAFIESGGFATQLASISDEVFRALMLHHQADAADQLHVLNAGCGEGECLRLLARRLASENVKIGGLWGTDTSKLAVRYAAKRQRESAKFAVCSPHALPFKDGSMDIVFAVNSPSPWEEFCRVLRPGGAVIVARPGGRHLQELTTRGNSEEAPKQFAAGLGEQYVRVCTEEHYEGALATHLLEMAGCSDSAKDLLVDEHSEKAMPRLATPVTVDLIISTHRVWLGTGGEPT